MSTYITSSTANPASTTDRALRRIVAEITDGLRHGYFEFRVTCEVIGQGRRRLVLHSGKSYQLVIPSGECDDLNRPNSPAEGGASTLPRHEADRAGVDHGR
jgi:hypothetical protein